MLEGVDYSWARPGGAALKAAGKHFAWRYLYADGQGGKGLDANEISDLTANGIELPVGYESTAQRSLSGRQAGIDDANAAQGQLVALGLPTAMPIYFASDFDVQDYAPGLPDTPENALAKLGPIAPYYQGIKDTIGLERAGAYGGYYLIKRLFNAGLISFGFQTYAWSGGQWDSRAQLQQYLNGQNINGAVDFVRATTGNYGQASQYGGAKPAPTPTPTPAPSPAPSGNTYTVVANDTLSGIGAKLGIDWHTIAALNNIQPPYTIYPGEVLKLSGNAPAPAPAPSANTYTVVGGDNLSTIASRFGTTVANLVALNKAKYPSLATNPGLIQPGWVLTISGSAPAPAPSEIDYTVVGGDNLSTIAAHYGTTVAQLVAWNKGKYPSLATNANLINVGWVLRVR